MKWRPIKELSDEQRDGRWWTFSSINSPLTNNYVRQYRYHSKDTGWMNEDGEFLYALGYDDVYLDFFLSEPLPDLPKPLKMEWIRFEDETPNATETILCIDEYNVPNVLDAHDPKIKQYTHWMPIISPEIKR